MFINGLKQLTITLPLKNIIYLNIYNENNNTGNVCCLLLYLKKYLFFIKGLWQKYLVLLFLPLIYPGTIPLRD